MNHVALVFLLVASPIAAFDADLAPFLEKTIPSDGEVAVPVVKPVDPNAPFPKLPPVEALLNTSSHTVNEIVSEVTKIQARVHNVEKQDQAKLAEKKAEFEAQLKGQEQETRDVIAENVQIAASITALQKGNQALRDSAKELQSENQAMREELRSAATKVSGAGGFIKESQKATDDRRSKVLTVLSEGAKQKRRQPVPEATDSDDDDDDSAQTNGATTNTVDSDAVQDISGEDKPKGLVGIFGHHSKVSEKAMRKAKSKEEVESKKQEDDDDDADDDKDDDKDEGKDDESFIQESMDMDSEENDSQESHTDSVDSSTVPFGHHHNPHHKEPRASVDGASKSMLQAVSQELKDLANEDEQGLERQMQLFHYELGQEHNAYKAALAQQRALNKTEASLLNLQSKLRRAEGHLQATRGHLQQRVRGLGQYLQHLAHLLLAPAKEAASLVEAMPQDVPIPAAILEASTPAPRIVPTGSAGAALLHLSSQAFKK